MSTSFVMKLVGGPIYGRKSVSLGICLAMTPNTDTLGKRNRIYFADFDMKMESSHLRISLREKALKERPEISSAWQ